MHSEASVSNLALQLSKHWKPSRKRRLQVQFMISKNEARNELARIK